MTLLIHELKRNLKSLLIWTLSVGILCGGCLLLFESLEESMAEMAAAYSSMGAFSAALGMDKMNIGTIEGFYATEIGLMFALGGAMFAAMTGASIVSKEEEGHTSEFLNTLPLGRGYIAGWKYGALVVLVLLFQVICLIFIGIGFAGAGEWPPLREFVLFHGTQILMQLEIGSICFLISAISKRRQICHHIHLPVQHGTCHVVVYVGSFVQSVAGFGKLKICYSLLLFQCSGYFFHRGNSYGDDADFCVCNGWQCRSGSNYL